MDSVFARPFVGRGNPEDWSVPPIQATPSSNAGTAAVVSLLRNDVFVYRHVERKRNISRKGGILRSLYTKQKAETQNFFLRFGFNRISNLFVNYII